jgi:hypothetical protein
MKVGVARSRCWRTVLAAGLGVSALGCVAGGLAWNAATAEYYAYAGYANALGEYLRENAAYPATLEALEAYYSGKGKRSGCIPPVGGRARPV